MATKSGKQAFVMFNGKMVSHLNQQLKVPPHFSLGGLLTKTKTDLEPVFLLDLHKAEPVEDADGVLTKKGMEVAHEYAAAWTSRHYRSVDIERQYPELVGLFYDIRHDPELAAEHALPME